MCCDAVVVGQLSHQTATVWHLWGTSLVSLPLPEHLQRETVVQHATADQKRRTDLVFM